MFSSLPMLARKHVAALVAPVALFTTMNTAGAASIDTAAQNMVPPTASEKVAVADGRPATEASTDTAAPRRHANAEHPGVAQWRHWHDAAPHDTNLFLVQPPASTRWTASSGQ